MTSGTRSITVDQFVAASPAKVWRGLTDPEVHAKWWAPGDIAPVEGHRFHLKMPSPWGEVACEVLEVVPEERFVYTFNGTWTLTWTLVAEGTGTRLLLEHSGFDLDNPQDRFALENMGKGWRTHVVPRLAQLAPTL
jgi:uncharacterized protein YndB with AHSA1/START domain